jgi:hypothetical protein
MVWEAIFLLLILKIPVVYLACVVWWAVRAEPAPPDPLEPALVTAPLEPDPRAGWRFLRGRAGPLHSRPRPHGSPRRRVARRAPLPTSWLATGWRDDA